MSFINRIFGGKAASNKDPKISFGRYSDAYKVPAQFAAWDKAQSLFEKERYLESYKAFMEYLRDEEEDNVRYNEVAGGLEFEIFQGSKKIIGKATPYQVKAEAKIVKAESFNVGIMRRLLEQNFTLRYSRFALDEEGNIAIIFDTSTIDGSPYKLYYALQEVATKADKQDDLLLEEFKNLELVEASHLEPLPQHEKEVKYNFIKQSIERVVEEAERPDLQKNGYSSSVGYMLLDLIFKLDYLIKPEGFMMEILERTHRQYYEKDGLPTTKKNKILCNGLRELLRRPPEDFYKEMYRVKCTFGITHSVNHDRVANFIANELPTMDWYLNNGMHRMAMSIPGYIAGYCMFNYAVPAPDRTFLALYYQITEAEYFRDLGFQTSYYDTVNQTFNKRAIRKAINKIADTFREKYPKLQPDTNILNFDNRPLFARSYLTMIRQLNLLKAV